MGAIIVVLSILLLLNRRGGRRERTFETPELFEMSAGAASADAPAMASAIETGDEPVDAPMTPVQPPRSKGDHEISLLPEKSSDIGSILMEADIYLAYRRYSQAESLIEEAMELNPESLELKAKLLEIYAFRRDKKSFSHYLDQIYPLLMNQSPDLWEKVADMGRQLLPEHAAWQQNETADTTALTVEPEAQDETLAEDDPLRQTPFDLDIDFGDLEVSGNDSEPVSFGDLVQDENGSEDDDIPSIDIDFDFDGPDEPEKDR
jgi:pilus assembly protein FimV